MAMDWTKPIQTMCMSASRVVEKIFLNEGIAEMRRAEFRPPVIRPWGVAPGARPRRVSRLRPGAMAVGWLALLLLAIAAVAALVLR